MNLTEQNNTRVVEELQVLGSFLINPLSSKSPIENE
jgi:hypothetical protein